MDLVPQRLEQWWRGLDDRGRRHASVIALISVGYIGHYLVYCLPQPFFIEDAAITFSYARNLVEGEGLVTWPGGERVEGYSNALWTFLMAALYALGVPMWTASKVMGAVFGVAVLPLAYDTVRRARPGANDDVALLAPLLLAASPQFTIWNASGLENSLFCILLASGIWRLLVELEPTPRDQARGRTSFPWSALLFFLLSMTRPEGVAYAAFAGLALVLDALATRRIRPLLRWIPVFAVPFVLYQAWRYWYFAWEFPNTYYAKLALKKTQFQPWNWTSKKGGWGYIRRWFTDHHVIWALPLFPLAAVGFRSFFSRWVVLFATVWLAIVIGWDAREFISRVPDWWRPFQREWIEIRVWSIAIALTLGGVLTLGRPGWRARDLLWICASFSVFFALYSKGDWMKAHRWFNLASVSLFPILTIGVGALLDALRIEGERVWPPRSWAAHLPPALLGSLSARAAILAIMGAGWVGSETLHIIAFANSPETSTRDIHRRVRYMSWVQRRLDVDDITLLDVDMGAHMYFSGWEILDIAGLVDVPIARHRDFNMDFMREYIFEEKKPEFAHVHGGWATASRIPRHKEWKDNYIEIPGYPITGTRLHVGNHIRKDLFVSKSEGPPADDVQRFEGGVRLHTVRIPSPEVPAGGLVFIDTAWQSSFRRSGFRALAVLDDGAGHQTVQALAPGYDWYPPDKWRTREVVHGRFRVRVPDDLPTGDYRLSFILLDEDGGQVLRNLGDMGSYRSDYREERQDRDGGAAEADRPATGDGDGSDTASEAVGDRYDTGWVVQVVSADRARAAAAEDHDAALALLDGSDCEAGWERFKDGARHVLADGGWREEREQAVKRAVAGCFVGRADAAEAPADRVAALTTARRWDRHHPPMLERSVPLAAELDAAGDVHFAAEEWAEAYRAFADAVALDPRRSWSRRKAEDARDRKLDITRPGSDPLPSMKKKDDEPKPPTLTDGPEKSRKDARAREGADADPTPDAEDPAPEGGAEGG